MLHNYFRSRATYFKKTPSLNKRKTIKQHKHTRYTINTSMKTFIFLLAFSFITFAGFSQKTLTGKVVGNDQQPLAYAAVSVSKKDTTKRYIASKITDSLGSFTLEVPSAGGYLVRARAVGYADKVVEISTDAPGNIVLDRTESKLSDVSVHAQKPLVERKADRLIMNIENNPLATGTSSMEAIGLAPGVLIRDGQIVLNGMTGTRVMVNGKLLKLSGDDLTNYLSALRSEEIQSIQIIAHPPAEYDAEGSGGLINIILKKQSDLGLYGSVYGNYTQGKYPETSEGAQLNFKKGKLGLFANYSYQWEKNFNKLNQSRTFPGDGVYSAQNRGRSKGQNQRIHTGLTFDFTDKQYIALDYTGAFSRDHEIFKANTQIRYPGKPEMSSTSIGSFPNSFSSDYHDVGLNYHITTDTLGSNFELLSDYTTNNGDATNQANSSFYDADNQFISDTTYKNITPSDAKIFTADAKYKWIFKNGSTFGFGSKISLTKIHNSASFSYVKDNEWLDNEDQNFIYNYKENIIAGYLNYNGHILDMDVQLGLRGENTHLTGTLYDTAGVKQNPRDYFSLFPSVYLTRKLNKDGTNSLSASYNRRLNRPGFSSLNPHVVYVDNYTSGRGNPYLTPEFNNAYELSFTLQNKYIFTGSYTKSTDVINNAILPEKNDEEKMTQQPINSGSTEIWMFSVVAPVQVTKWWMSQNTLQLSNQHAIAEAFDLQENIAMLQSAQVFQLGKGYSVNASSYYLNKVIFANAVLHHIFNTDLAIQKKFFNNKLTVKLAGRDIFGTSKVKGRFYYDDFRLNFNQLQQSQKITLGLTYNFNLGKAFKAKNVQSSNADEKNRL